MHTREIAVRSTEAKWDCSCIYCHERGKYTTNSACLRQSIQASGKDLAIPYMKMEEAPDWQ
jgi:hypothetical protein